MQCISLVAQRITRFFLIAILLILIPGTPTAAASLDIESVGNFGVQVKHERTTSEELKRIKATGFDWVRFDMRWSAVERKFGKYNWSEFDLFIKELHEQHLRAIIILFDGNPIYTGMTPLPPGNAFLADAIPTAPQNETDISAFALFAEAAVDRYKDQDIIWEIWNEPDLNLFWPPQSDAKTFTSLAVQTCHAMRQASPTAKIIGPALAYISTLEDNPQPKFLETLLRSDAPECFDALSVHPYRHGKQRPESVLEDYKKLRNFIAQHTPPNQKPLPLISSEWGYTLTEVTPEQQAAYALRSYLSNLMSGVSLSIWYEWRDTREGKDDPEAHYGLVEINGNEKVSQKLLKDILPKIHDAVIKKRILSSNMNDYALLMHKPDGQNFLIFWSANEDNQTSSLLRIQTGEHRGVFLLNSKPQLIALGDDLPQITIQNSP